MDEQKIDGGKGDTLIGVVAWVFAIGFVLAATFGAWLLIGPVHEALETVRTEAAQRPPAPAPASASGEGAVELGVLYPVNGFLPSEAELRAAGMRGADEAEAPSDEHAPGDLLTLSIVVPPSWVEQPRPDFPRLAASRNVASGRVQLECFVRANGVIAACMVLDETPPDLGFGRAAIASTRDARLTPRTVDGVPTPGRIRFTTSFRLE